MSEANKAVMWAVKDPSGNYIGFSDNNPLTEAGMWFKGVRYSIEFWNMAYVSRGWQIKQVEVREIVNPENTQP